MNIGSAIKKCREVQRSSLSDLATKSNISISFLSLIERGEREPSISTINSIAFALGIPASLLILLAAEPQDLKLIDEELSKRLSDTILNLLDEKSKQQTLL